MSLATAFTPRVHGIVLCDMAAEPDPPEWGVIDLEKVRQHAALPRFDSLQVFLHLEYFRGGQFSGYVKVLLDDDEVFTRPFSVDFDPGGPYVGLWVGVLRGFDVAGRYQLQVWFQYDPEQRDILKGERSFDVVEDES